MVNKSSQVIYIMPSSKDGKNAISAYVDNDTYSWIRGVQSDLETKRKMPVSMSLTITHIVTTARNFIHLPDQ